MKKILLLILITASVLTASAQTKHQKTLQLFKLMGVEKNADQIAANIVAVLGQSNAAAKDPQKVKEMSDLLQSEMKIVMPQMMNDMVPVYEKYFTEQEIQKYIDFYSSPEGKKLVASTPVLQKEMLQIMVSKYMPQMKERIDEKMKKN